MKDLLFYKVDRTAVDVIFEGHHVDDHVEFEEQRRESGYCGNNPFSFSLKDLKMDLVSYIATVRAELLSQIEENKT